MHDMGRDSCAGSPFFFLLPARLRHQALKSRFGVRSGFGQIHLRDDLPHLRSQQPQGGKRQQQLHAPCSFFSSSSRGFFYPSPFLLPISRLTTLSFYRACSRSIFRWAPVHWLVQGVAPQQSSPCYLSTSSFSDGETATKSSQILPALSSYDKQTNKKRVCVWINNRHTKCVPACLACFGTRSLIGCTIDLPSRHFIFHLSRHSTQVSNVKILITRAGKKLFSFVCSCSSSK